MNLKHTTAILILLIALTMTACDGGSSSSSEPAAGWVSYNPAGGTVWYDTVTGLVTRQGTEECANQPVALDFHPSDGVLMGMAADGKLMTINTRGGKCNAVNLGSVGTQLAGLGQPVIGFAVNPDGVYAVLTDDGMYGRVITFKEGDATFKSDITLWAGLQPPALTEGRAFGIDFMDTDDTSRLIVASRKAVGPQDERGGTHVIRYNPDATFLDDSVGGEVTYGAYNPGNNDIVIANGEMYVREGNGAYSAGYVVKFELLTHSQSEYSGDHHVLLLEDNSGTNLSNTALAVRF